MSDAAEDVKWIATLSDGTTAAEHTGNWTLIPGERKPWIRLCKYAAQNGLTITSLRLNFRGRTIHLPRSNFDRFDMNATSRSPLYYSLAYHVELDMTDGDLDNQTRFIDIAAHYPDEIAVHYIQDTTDGNNSWVVVTQGQGRNGTSPDIRWTNGPINSN
jgi:hypothetical protein